MAKTYYAAIKKSGTPKTLEVIAEGSRERCAGAIDAWKAVTLASAAEGLTPLIVVEVTE